MLMEFLNTAMVGAALCAPGQPPGKPVTSPPRDSDPQELFLGPNKYFRL
jgi:hypothetical protein